MIAPRLATERDYRQQAGQIPLSFERAVKGNPGAVGRRCQGRARNDASQELAHEERWVRSMAQHKPNWLVRGPLLGSVAGAVVAAIAVSNEASKTFVHESLEWAIIGAVPGAIIGAVVGLIGGAVIWCLNKWQSRSQWPDP
jgi:hypothetical protein